MTQQDEAKSRPFDSVDLRVALGLLRLCTDGRPEDIEATAVVHAALNAGGRVLDTADVYCLDENDVHYGEHFVRQCLNSWKGPADEVCVLTKAGLKRVGRRWMPCGHPEHLRQAIDGSLQALGVERIFALQLHARDPRVPFEDTLGALAELQQEGKILHLGLCNTSVAEIKQASRHFDVALVQNELGVHNLRAASEGLLQYTAEEDISFLAYRPLGGKEKAGRLNEDPVLVPLSQRYSVTPQQIAVAAVLDAAPHAIALVGATRVSSIRSSVGAAKLQLDASDRTAISFRYSFESQSVPSLSGAATPGMAQLPEGDGPQPEPEVVILMGIMGAGKSELVESYVDTGYVRLNRDLIGGKLDDLVPLMEHQFANGITRVVLDNTYPTRLSRAPVIEAARRWNIPIRCRFLDTPIQEAYINICRRMVAKYGMPLGPDEMKMFRRVDPTLPPPLALARWTAGFEPPAADEGFGAVERIPFRRRINSEHQGLGLLLDVDGTLRETISGEHYPRHPDDVRILPGRTEVLSNWIAAGYELFFVSNQSGVASMRVGHDMVQAAFFRTQKMLNVPVNEVVYCPHPHHPVGCFCRKPMPGLGVYLMERHQLGCESLVMVGDRETDAEFAAGLGITYHDADDFFLGSAGQI